MTRYQKVKEKLDTLRPQDRRVCPNINGCACIGCAGEVNGVRIKEHEIKLYIEGKL